MKPRQPPEGYVSMAIYNRAVRLLGEAELALYGPDFVKQAAVAAQIGEFLLEDNRTFGMRDLDA